MAFSKAAHYSRKLRSISMYARSMDHPARLKILEQLSSGKSICVQELAKGHPLCQSAMSEHLGPLREKGLVAYREKFPYTYYSMDRKNVEQVRECFNSFFDSLLEEYDKKRE